jgi:beta-alanine--pyruvate transaminase
MWEKGFYVRCGGATIQLAPSFITEKSEIDVLINALGGTINEQE